MAIRIFSTGGTIEGLEYAREDLAPLGAQPILPELLQRAGITADYILEPLLFKDSKFIGDSDRELLFKKAAAALEKRIIITHGTDSMVQTAQFFASKKLDKVIVLTGAMILGTLPDSDAVANLKFSFDAIGSLDPGVYICMHGQVFAADKVKKNLGKGRFESL